MFILPRDEKDLGPIRARLLQALPASRFTLAADVEPVRAYGPCCVRLRRIRLLQPKDYCGQHSGPCPVTPFPRPHTRARYLEGADWVAFDDMINDILDRGRIEANVWSKGREFLKPYYIRRGRARRTAYPAIRMARRGNKLVVVPAWAAEAFWVWDPDEANGFFSEAHFGARGDAPRSTYQEGTPGIPEWRKSRCRRRTRVS